MLPSLGDYLLAETLRYQLVPFRDIRDQRFLQSHWMRDKTCLAQPKVVVSVKKAYLYLMTNSMQ